MRISNSIVLVIGLQIGDKAGLRLKVKVHQKLVGSRKCFSFKNRALFLSLTSLYSDASEKIAQEKTSKSILYGQTAISIHIFTSALDDFEASARKKKRMSTACAFTYKTWS